MPPAWCLLAGLYDQVAGRLIRNAQQGVATYGTRARIVPRPAGARQRDIRVPFAAMLRNPRPT